MKKPKHVAVIIFKLSFNCIYIIKFVSDCTIIYILLIIENKTGISPEKKILDYLLIDRSIL